jgi:octanoyl-[GcvH]:protein N-octanoyltransferase
MADALEQAIIASLRATAGLPVRTELRILADPQHGVDADTPQLVIAGHDTRWLRVWRNRRCLVASRRQGRLPHFAKAAAASAAVGWPVAVRRSGGTTVAHRPGVLNISLVSLCAGDSNPGMQQDYLALLEIIARALAPLGIAAGHGAVAGAHCDGRYNLVWQGRKLAGTAGFVTRVNGMGLRVFHASLAVDGDLAADLAAIARFERMLGENPQYDTQSHVSVAQILADRNTRPTGSIPQRATQTGER